ncbi:carboxylesterase/lipase family protein [Rhodococcus sovatensis]|uniref:Carboxylic ester hydrolase n=1 Tax=Rhodococcus sovatensis TaxID=1805840 RepID=A0ABZ2PI12_9NOCA
MTQAGLVRGRVVVLGGVAVHAFLGIPFAGPLRGPTRFEEPSAVSPWDGVRPATEHGPTVPQGPYPPAASALLDSVMVVGEDALNLSVWTSEPGQARLPVMVWIHGGAFVRGSHRMPVFDGAAFARDGVVVVGINYRVGALGFLSVAGLPENRGLRDQIAALEWVRDNIAAFGGDPEQVTVFGESAGGMSIACLLGSPSARGLFRRAIIQSANAISAAELTDARFVTRELASMLGIGSTPADFAEVSQQRLQTAQDTLGTALVRDPDPARWGATVIQRGFGVMSMFPTIDGEVLTALPIEAIAAGAGDGVELLAGTTRDEFRFFMVPSGFSKTVSTDELPVLAARFGIPRSTTNLFTGNRPTESAGDVLCALLTDHAFRAGTSDLVDEVACSNGGRAWQYEFSWRTAVQDLRACHALELPFVFDTLAHAPPLVGENPPQALADDMHMAWVRFATTGNPGWEKVGIGRAVRIFGDPAFDASVVIDPRDDELCAMRSAHRASAASSEPVRRTRP